jgi:UDPglucose 6-dehydrogenase
LSLVYIAKSLGLDEVASYWEMVVSINDYQKERILEIILSALNNTIANKKIVILGWSFKKDTNDSRESPAIKIAQSLIEEKAKIHIIDPKVQLNQVIQDLKQNFDQNLIDTDSIFASKFDISAFKDAHAVLLLTEWDEFTAYNYAAIFKLMNKPSHIFDTRRILDEEKLKNIGFKVFKIGQ